MFGIDDAVAALFKLGGAVADRVLPNQAARDAAHAELDKMRAQGELDQLVRDHELVKGQLEIDKVEAANPNLFVSGARPFILWVCGSAFAWNFIAQPLLNWIAAAAGHPVNAPALDLSVMMPVLIGILGLGGYRSLERIKGVIPRGK